VFHILINLPSDVEVSKPIQSFLGKVFAVQIVLEEALDLSSDRILNDDMQANFLSQVVAFLCLNSR